MHKYSWLLYTGLAFIFSGILARVLSFEAPLPAILISTGGVVKIIFMALIFRQNKVRPGYETLLLLFGLGFVILGAQLRNHDAFLALALPATIAGITLKAMFLFAIIRKVRTARIRSRQNN